MPTVLTVGAGQQYQTIAAAIAAANQIGSNVTVKILAGTYVNDGGTITASNVTVEGMGGVAKLVGASAGTGGKAAIIASGANTVLTTLDISGVTGTGDAGVIYGGGTLHLLGVHLHDNQTGVAAATTANGLLEIKTSEVDNNGSASGGGNVDAGGTGTLSLYMDYVHDALGGSEIRSTALQTSILYSTIVDSAGSAAHVLDLPKGGTVTITGDTLERGPGATTKAMISLGSAGTLYANSSVVLNDDHVLNDGYPNAGVSLFDRAPPSATFSDDDMWNVPSLGAAAPAGTVTALSARGGYIDPLTIYVHPSIKTVTGLNDGGVTLRGGYAFPNATVSIGETVDGRTTLLGTAATDGNGGWSLTSHIKIDASKVHAYTLSVDDVYGNVASMPGALFLTDSGTDRLTSPSDGANVFTIMSFKGADVIDGFKTAKAAGSFHDIVNFSGRGITSFAQVQAMMSGSSSTVMTMASGKTITLTGVAPTTLSIDDFAYS